MKVKHQYFCYRCTCPDGYIGDGKVCYGNILQVSLNTLQNGSYK